MPTNYLKNTKIFRGGITAPSLKLEKTCCSFDGHHDGATMSLVLASKGGGETLIEVRIGRDDLLSVLDEIARKVEWIEPEFKRCEALAHSADQRRREEIRDMACDFDTQQKATQAKL